MKNFYYMMLGIFASIMMTSCDDDVERSMNLSGSWEGNLNMYYGIEDRFGNYREYDAYSSDIAFFPDYDYATHGYGKQVDWYDEGPYEKQYYHFDWSIRDGVIYLTYPYDPELDTVICDYNMGRDYFTGYFENSKYKFRLRKITDYYDWSYYSNDWDHRYWDSPSWSSPTRAVDADNETPEFTVVKRGQRAAK